MKIRKPIIQLFSILCLVFLAAAPQTSFADFKIVVIGDTQNHQSQTSSLTQSIVNTISDVAFVAQMGDVVNTCGESYVNQSNAYNTLDNADIPYGVAEGNHDSGCAGFDTYFGASRYSGSNYPEGYYQGSSGNRNHYFFFSAGGMDFIVFILQYSPTAQYTWANNLMAANVNRRAIVVSHNIISYNDAYVNQATYTSLSANPNLFLMLCGHMHTGSDGEGYKQEPRSGMNPVHIVMTDYQDFGTNVLRPLTFSPATDLITVSHGQGTGSTFTLPYNMLYGDINAIDCDVDGSDMAVYIADYTNYTSNAAIDVATFASNLGKTTCQ